MDQPAKYIPLRVIWDQPEILFVDATPTQLGLVHNDYYLAVPLLHDYPIYWAETLVVILALYYALCMNISQIHVFTDNMGTLGAVCEDTPYLRFLCAHCITSRLFSRFTISYIATDQNPADLPSRFRPA